MKNSKEKTIPAWHRFLNYAVISDGHVSQAEAIKLGYAKDKKALSNIIYVLENVKKLITHCKMFDHESNTLLYEIFLTDAGEKFIRDCTQTSSAKRNEQPEQNNDVVITYNGDVVHSFKKDDVVRFLDFLDDILTDFAIAGILN